MKNSALEDFITSVKNNWKGLNSETVIKSKALLENLANTSDSEPWIADLHNKKQASVELYRDKKHGFILLAHIEMKGQYRKPHNHGDGWVFYAIQYGRMAMSTYWLATDTADQSQIVSRGSRELSSGECNVYLPGDIHDTKCISDYVLMFRLTSCDFKEEKCAGRLTQYNIKV